jgi:hypothetical protein
MRYTLDRLFPLYIRYGLKMGVATGLSYAVSHSVSDSYSIWAVVSAVVAMQLNVAESLQAALGRIGGTAAGAAMGVALLLCAPHTYTWMGVAVVVIAVLCGYLARFTTQAASIAIAAIVVLLTGAAHMASGGAASVTFGLMRLLEIVIGVGSAVLVSLLLWPVRLVDTLQADLGLQFLEGARLVDDLAGAFLDKQRNLPYSLLSGIEKKVWDNHERLNKARKHESILFHYEHAVMSVQVTALDRTAESLRSMMEALNDYDEEGVDPVTGPELRSLADVIMAALRHLGGPKPDAAAPDLIRGLTSGVAGVESKLSEMRRSGATKSFNLHKMLQIFAFYQAMRMLAESLLVAMDRIQAKKSA